MLEVSYNHLFNCFLIAELSEIHLILNSDRIIKLGFRFLKRFSYKYFQN